jgi:hypothetical protein
MTRIGAAIVVLVAWAAAPAHADPVLTYASYLGGTSDEADVFGSGVVDVAVDDSGYVYVTGTTRSADFPTTPGMDDTLDGDLDIFVTKLSPTGEVVYSTYLGGPCDDVVRDLAVVGTPASVYLTGRINGGWCFGPGPAGAVVVKLDSTGDVLWSYVLGGSVDDASIGEAIAVDATGMAYVTGVAQSASHDFPTTEGAFRTQDCGGADRDVFVARVTKNPRLAYSAFLCGTGDEVPSAIAFDYWGSIYVAGTTASSDFPAVAALQSAPRGGPGTITGFVTKIAPLGEQIAWSTYLGGSLIDDVRAMAIDDQGNVYVTGETQSFDYPTTAGALQDHAGSRLCPACSDAFVTKIDASGSALAYSTYLFGELDDGGYGIAVDGAGNAYVAGTTTSTYFPIVGAFQRWNRGLADAFVAKLAPDGGRLLYSSYLGGSNLGPSPATGWDKGTRIALDAAGDAWVAGYTLSYDLPTTVDAVQPNLAFGICAELETPCGDAFFAKIGTGGPAPPPAIDVTVTPHQLEPRGTLTASWAGLPAPTAADELRLIPLGASGEKAPNAGDLVVTWPTTGQAAGSQTLDLPGWVASGWWEMRLVSTDPDAGTAAVMARSEPVLVVTVTTTTTTTVPPPTIAPHCDAGRACRRRSSAARASRARAGVHAPPPASPSRPPSVAARGARATSPWTARRRSGSAGR